VIRSYDRSNFIEDMKSRVFLSYAKEDKEIVERVYNEFERSGFRPFMAPKDVPTGVDWKQELKTAIESADPYLSEAARSAIRKLEAAKN